MLTRLYLLLLAFLTLGVDPPADPPGDVDPPDDPDEIEIPDLEGDPPADPDTPDPDDPDTIRAELKEAKTKLEVAERNAREAADRAAAAERTRTQAPPPPSQEQQLFEHEEARLKAADLTAMEKWQIESSRAIRANSRMARDSLMRAEDMTDKADFDRLAASKPGIAKQYGDRVEAKLKELRNGGGNLPRRMVLKMLIGDDIVEGKATAKKRAAPADATGKIVDRGKPPSGRSDVRSRGAANTESAKRKARLENQII